MAAELPTRHPNRLQRVLRPAIHATIVICAARRPRPRHHRPLSSSSSFQVNHRTPSNRHRPFDMAGSKSRWKVPEALQFSP